MAMDPGASPPAPTIAAASARSLMYGRARDVGIRVGGLAFAILIVILIFTALSKPNTFLSLPNALVVMRYMSTIAIVALGLTLVIVVGEIDLSFGYMYGLGATLISVSWIVWGWSIWLSIGLAFAVAIVVGCVNAFLVTRLAIPSFIVTLGTGQLIFGLTLLVSGTNTYNPVYPPEGKVVPQEEIDAFFAISNQSLPLGIPMQGVWMIGVAIVIGFLLSRSLFGFRLKAIGGNPRAAELARLPIAKYKYVAFIVCAVLATLATTLDFAFIGSTQPNLGLSLLFPVFAAVIIGGASLSGGRGTAIGTLSGALLLAIIQDGLALLSAAAYLQQFVQGTVTIAAVVLDRFTAGLRR
jgi:ribose/xylose/arabinose/galactoside ABC-type transport system permease subunit